MCGLSAYAKEYDMMHLSFQLGDGILWNNLLLIAYQRLIITFFRIWHVNIIKKVMYGRHAYK